MANSLQLPLHKSDNESSISYYQDGKRMSDRLCEGVWDKLENKLNNAVIKFNKTVLLYDIKKSIPVNKLSSRPCMLSKTYNGLTEQSSMGDLMSKVMHENSVMNGEGFAAAQAFLSDLEFHLGEEECYSTFVWKLRSYLMMPFMPTV